MLNMLMKTQEPIEETLSTKNPGENNIGLIIQKQLENEPINTAKKTVEGYSNLTPFNNSEPRQEPDSTIRMSKMEFDYRGCPYTD